MLNYEQTANIVNIIKKDMSVYEKEPKKAQQAYKAIYTYLNHAGGHTPIPKELKTYKNILAIFQDPYKILTSIKKDPADEPYFNNKAAKQEMQTLALLWLREAMTKPSKDIDLHIIINQYNSNTIH